MRLSGYDQQLTSPTLLAQSEGEWVMKRSSLLRHFPTLMRWRRPLVLAALVVAIILGVWAVRAVIEWYRSRVFEGQVRAFNSGEMARYCTVRERSAEASGRPGEAARWRLRAVYFARLKHKYEHAAARLWLPVEPEPPPP
jgi:hypothetical protein